jgi:dienelactone hydrolase
VANDVVDEFGSGGGTIDLAPYEQESDAVLSYLAGQPGIDRDRLMVLGHSEGALYALLLATGTAGPAL